MYSTLLPTVKRGWRLNFCKTLFLVILALAKHTPSHKHRTYMLKPGVHPKQILALKQGVDLFTITILSPQLTLGLYCEETSVLLEVGSKKTTTVNL